MFRFTAATSLLLYIVKTVIHVLTHVFVLVQTLSASLPEAAKLSVKLSMWDRYLDIAMWRAIGAATGLTKRMRQVPQGCSRARLQYMSGL